jgi:hypothetical protein
LNEMLGAFLERNCIRDILGDRPFHLFEKYGIAFLSTRNENPNLFARKRNGNNALLRTPTHAVQYISGHPNASIFGSIKYRPHQRG